MVNKKRKQKFNLHRLQALIADWKSRQPRGSQSNIDLNIAIRDYMQDDGDGELAWLKSARKTGEATLEKIRLLEGFFAVEQGELLTEIELMPAVNTTSPGNIVQKELTLPPFKPDLFLGRDAALKQIFQRLNNGVRILHLVNGEGGIGKTTLASQYYYQYREVYHHCAWLLAQQDIQSALLSLEPALGLIAYSTETVAQRFEKLILTMRSLGGPCLLVIDNANEIDDLRLHYAIFNKLDNFHILVTTRITKLEQATSLTLGALSDADCKALFRQYYPSHHVSDSSHNAGEDSLLARLSDAVGSNTLVLELMAKNLAHINEFRTHYQLADLVLDLENKGVLNISKSVPVSTTYGQVDGITMATPEAVIGAMYDLSALNQSEVSLLTIFALLPAEGIHFDLLDLLFADDELVLDENLRSLSHRGWISYDERQTFKCSPVVQEITKQKNKRFTLDCQPVIEALANQLAYQPGTRSLVGISYELAGKLVRYANHVLRSITDVDINIAVLLERMGSFYSVSGHLEASTSCFEKARLIIQALVDNAGEQPESLRVLGIAYDNLAETHGLLGDYTLALEFAQKGNEIFKRFDLLDSRRFIDHLAVSHERLGIAYEQINDMQQARFHYRRHFDLFSKLIKQQPKNPRFRKCMAIAHRTRGTLFQKADNSRLALKHYQQAKKLFRALYQQYPANPSYTEGLAVTYGLIGRVFAEDQKYKKSLSWPNRRLQLFQQLLNASLGNADIQQGLAISHSNMGNAYLGLKHYDQALLHFNQRLALGKQLYEAHPHHKGFKFGLAVAYKLRYLVLIAKGDFKTAVHELLLSRALLSALVVDCPNEAEFRLQLNWVNNMARLHERN